MGARGQVLASAAGRGVVAGLVGTAAMTLTEKVEQRVWGRPDSYVPGRALLRAAGRSPSESSRPLLANHAMHWATGGLFGALRALWSANGIRGGQATATHSVTRLAFDQTVENLSGAGAPPASWPRGERAIDVVHKTVYAVVTGALADAWVAPAAGSGRGRTSH
jgi:hypothetical protein